jgi:putative ABC transport system permease protein
MLRNYILITWRNLLKSKAFSLINILGLAIGLAACLIVLQYVSFQLSYDDFHRQADRIYRVAVRWNASGQPEERHAQNHNAAGPALLRDFPEVASFVRIRGWQGDVVVNHTAGLSPDLALPVTFTLAGFLDSARVSLAGNFNGWNPNEEPMTRTAQGWQTTIHLPPGRYAYKFSVNHTMITDPANPAVDTTDHHNSIRVVGETPQYRRAARQFRQVSFLEEKAYFVDSTFLSVFSFPLLKGDPRTALADPGSVLLSESAARKHFGNEDPLGRTLHFRSGNRDQPKTITGIFKDPPANSHLQFRFLMPYASLGDGTDTDWGRTMAYTYLLLKPGADPAALEAKFPGFIQQYRGESLRRENLTESFFLQPLRSIHLGSDARQDLNENGSLRMIYFLIVIALFILVIAWVNYINLSTARALGRAREVGVRKVVGATRGQLIGQFMLEALLLNGFALLLSLTLVQGVQPVFARFIGEEQPFTVWQGYQFWLVFGGLVVGGTLLSGLYPAFVLSAYRPVSMVKGNWGRSPGGAWLRKGLVTTQFVISMLLIVGTYTVQRQLSFMRNRDLGLNVSQTLVVKSPVVADYSKFDAAFDVFRNGVIQLPRIKSFTMTDAVPGTGTWSDRGIARDDAPEASQASFSLIWADYDFVQAFGIKPLAGRSFSRDFSTDGQAAVLNEAAVRALGFAGPAQAVGQKIRYGKDYRYEVVGVLPNYHQRSLKEDYVPMIFLLNPRAGRHYSLKISAENIPATLAQVEKVYGQAWPESPFQYFFLDEFFNQQYQADHQFGRVFSLFASLAVFVACLGLFGLTLFTTVQRTQEIGIRKVMGASTERILLLLSKDFLRLVLLAIVLAVPLAYLGVREWLSGYTFRIGITTGLFVVPAVAVLGVALLTVSFQTWKAARANPANSLRAE